MEKKKRTYKAVIDGERVEWINGKPETDVPLEVEISVWEEDRDELQDRKERRARAAAALREIAKRGGVPEIPDPVAWQREIRKDRPLPGRAQ